MIALLWLARVMAVAFFIGLGWQQWRTGCDFSPLRFGVPVRCVLSAAWSVWPLAIVSLAGVAALVWLERRDKNLHQT